MPEQLIVTGGLLIDPAVRIEAVRDVLIEDGKISAVGTGLSRKSALKGVPAIDAKGKWVIPGLVDMHVHLREPGREGDETIETGTKAAARGGVTTVLAMANTEPVTDTASQLAFLRAKARTDAAITVLFAGAVTVGQKGERLTEFAKLRAAGAAALSDDGRPVMNAGLLRRALEYADDLGLLVIDHCEDLTLSNGACVHEGATALRKGLKGAPGAAETVQVLRDIALAQLTGARLHIAHVSTSASVEAIRTAKKNGVRISAEAAPHHFALIDKDMPGYDADWKMNPPLRSGEDRQALLEGLADGTLDAIATDHAPHGCASKALGMDLAPFGVIGLETSLAVALTDLFHKKVLTRRKLVERMSMGPAALLGLKHKGTLAPGADADLVVVDPDAAWTPAAPFFSKSRNTPFAGRRLKGRALTTLSAGRVVHAL
ncbi:MAG: dihydroorotase [Elusimicrobia bacterium]|nr:dihydroorotase [Elusimicrobiota bacterium]